MNILKHKDKICSWNKIDWKFIEGQVFKWQRQIYTASKENDIKKVRILQNRLFSSHSAKLLAIRRITQDKISPKERLSLAGQLKFPTVRRVWGKLEKGPTIHDRCLQALLKLGLEPEWEARFEPNSYGFRPGRNAHDAIITIKNCIQKGSKYVLDADIAKSFDTIDHEALLEKIGFKGKIRKQIKFWLEAGLLDRGLIYPLLANIALDGLEDYLKDCFADIPVFYKSGNKLAHERLDVIHYADDFVVLHENLEIILRCRAKTEEFLNQMGLRLSDSKTRLTHTLELKESDRFDGKVGFNFLGFTVKQFHTKNQGKKVGYKTLIYPSTESIKAHQAHLHQVVLKEGKKLDHRSLVNKLNPIVRGWANYFGVSHANTTGHLGKQDYLLYLKLRKWAKRIKGKSGKAVSFWYHSKEKKWCFGKTGQFTLALHTTIGTQSNPKLIYHNQLKIPCREFNRGAG